MTRLTHDHDIKEPMHIYRKYKQYNCVHGPEYPGRRGHIKLKDRHPLLGRVYACTKCKAVLFNIK